MNYKMKYKLVKPIILDAVQWTGENIREVQELMAPASPLTQSSGTLGVNVYRGEKYLETELKFANKGDYIAKDERGFHIFPQTRFEEGYALVAVEETYEEHI